jgi:protein-tyrosine-phosphatase
VENANLTALRGLAEGRTTPRLALYLDDQDVPDPWGQPDGVFTACVEFIEAGAHQYLP